MINTTKIAQLKTNTGQIILLTAVLLTFVSEIRSAFATSVCTIQAAQIVSVQGDVELLRAQTAAWQPAELDMSLCAGDKLRVRTHGRAAIRLNNNSVLRLDQRTTITIPQAEAENDPLVTLIELIEGAIHVITRTPQPFRIKTPFFNAGVEGTEFLVETDSNLARVVMFEGRLTAKNEFGSVTLTDHEAAIAHHNGAPQKEIVVKPLDAVQWALYYPAIDTTLKEVEYLLSVGRTDEANDIIDSILADDPGNSNAIAIQSIIAVVQNEKDHALELAQQAVKYDHASAPAWLALAYAQQAAFNLDAALTSTKQAAEYDPENALIWARLAELQLSHGRITQALETAQKAVALNPSIAKTQTVLGFAHLLQINTKTAQAIFREAIQLDQANPMPRLGLGLALIRAGKLEAGRIEIEIAASLDPGNALIRSYLGKTYFEEKRYSRAETQFGLAKTRDPFDPTPWFYDAIQKQTQNRPIEALHDIQKSIELNDNRAVYRSKLLLDQDQAGRGSSLARIYDNLGFEKRAIMETAKSLSFDPANHSAHRFLSDTYANIQRHEVARVSELLQAQLLQPINVNPVQPQLAVADLNVITNTGPTAVGFNEFTPLMERNKPQLVASLMGGSHDTISNETVLSAVYDRVSASLGQYHFQSDGFRENNDQRHNIYNAFVQYAVTPKLNIQAEIRRRETRHGDLLLDFDTAHFRNLRRHLDQDTVRAGARYALSPRHDFIVSGMYADRQEDVSGSSPSGFDVNTAVENKGYQIEGQYLFREEYFNLVAGGGAYNFDVQNQVQFCPGPCIPTPVINFSRKRENAYLYSNFNYPKNVTATLGVSYDTFKDFTDLKFDTFNPKFGLQWNIVDALRLRLAWFETVKAALITNQTLEPTQVAGFNQLFDDTTGTRARRMGVGLDFHFSKKLYGGLEVSERDLKVPFADGVTATLLVTEKQQERLYRAYLYWLPHKHWTINGEFKFERYTRNATDIGGPDKPYDIQTLNAPMTINYFHPSGFFSTFTTTYVQQHLKRLATSTLRDGTDDFVLFDAAIGYRLPNRRGLISFEARNLSDENFFYRNINFQLNEAITPRFIPTRTFFGRVTLNF